MPALAKFLHTSDLHLGKKLFGFSIEEDQRHFLNEILEIAEKEEVEGIIIAGDIYDVTQPPEDAVRLFGEFIRKASNICSVYAIAGNHDSAERLGFARELLAKSNVFFTGRYKGKAERFALKNEVNIYMLPYMKTSSARNLYGDQDIRNPDQAVKVTLEHSDIDPKEINILVAHQFIAGRGAKLKQSDSETQRLSVGMDEMIHSDLFDAFDYGAFGHIHTAQLAGRRELQYCGTPMKYSESEIDDRKKVNIVTIKGKGDVEIEPVFLEPLREAISLRGTFDEVFEKARNLPKGVQVYVTLTESADRANERLSAVCDTLFHLSFDIPRKAVSGTAAAVSEMERLSDTELFERFYTDVKGDALSEEQEEIVKSVMGVDQ